MGLLSKIVRHDALKPAIEWGLREEDFLTDEGRAIYQHMLMMIRDPRFNGSTPGVNVMALLYPNFDMCDDESVSLEAYCTMVREGKLAVEVQSAFREALASPENAVERTTKLMDRLQRNVLSVAYGQRDDVNFADALTRIVADYDLKESGVDLSVGKWPWDSFNETSGGLQNDDYIVLYGRPKSKKSWVLAAFIASLYLQDKTVLIYTKEMTADNIFTRVAACIVGVPYQELRTGRLSREDRQKLGMLQQVVAELQATQRMICLNGKDSSGNDTVEWLEAKAKKYKPDIIFIDGLYLMNDSRGSKNQKDNFRVQNISRACRQMVLTLGIPLVATLQATRAASAHKSANLDEIAFSDAIGQDVTCAIRVINEDDTPGQEKITLVVGGSREYKFSGCRIWGKCANDFGWIENLSQREIDSIKQKDERGDEKAAGVLPNGAPNPGRKVDPKKGLPTDRQQVDRHFDSLKNGGRPTSQRQRPGMRAP